MTNTSDNKVKVEAHSGPYMNIGILNTIFQMAGLPVPNFPSGTNEQKNIAVTFTFDTKAEKESFVQALGAYQRDAKSKGGSAPSIIPA